VRTAVKRLLISECEESMCRNPFGGTKGGPGESPLAGGQSRVRSLRTESTERGLDICWCPIRVRAMIEANSNKREPRCSVGGGCIVLQCREVAKAMRDSLRGDDGPRIAEQLSHAAETIPLCRGSIRDRQGLQQIHHSSRTARGGRGRKWR
jgi:hypothetical protein